MDSLDIAIAASVFIGACVACYYLGRMDEAQKMWPRIEAAEDQAERYKTLYELNRSQPHDR